MTDLTDAQLVLLSAAAQRPDRLLPFGDRVRGAAAYRCGQPLVERGYARMVDARPEDPLWEQEQNGKRHALRITVRGLQAVGIELEIRDLDPDGIVTDQAERAAMLEEARRLDDRSHATSLPVSPETLAAFAKVPAKALQHSKKALVIDMLRREEGASIDEIVDATGWLPHTTRAVLTGLRKAGMEIARVQRAGFATRYRIVDAAGAGDNHAGG